MSKTEHAVEWMINTAKDNRHGYDQKYRWGELGDYDCSSAVITAWQSAGVPVKTNGATYTGNMYNAFKKSGFIDVTRSVNLKNGAGLVSGDVLLNRNHHTALYIGAGKLAQASINEKGGTIGGVPGDQTGREVNISPYYNFPWNYVLRYNEPNTDKHSNVGSITDAAYAVIRGEYGNGSDRVNRLKNAGYDPKKVQNEVNRIMKNGSFRKSNEQVADEVIRGLWGNGSNRIRKLRNAGYDPQAIQMIVNRKIAGN